jgi:hypothetical protein
MALGVNMRSKMLVLFLLIISATSPLFDNSAAQSTVAAVDLECTAPYPSGTVEIEVYPGATLSGYTVCTVSNPSAHTEKIQIQVTADGLVISAPGSFTLAAGAEEDFQVIVRADSRMTMSARNLVVTATVTETSGVPPPNNAESRVTQIINIMQFAEFSLELEEAIVTVYAGSDINLELKIYNTGNWVDRFLISMETESLENVNLSLPASAVQIESRSAPHRVRVQLIAPAAGSDWPINSDGLHTMEIEFDITVKSDFSCTQTSGCMSETVTQKVIFLQNQTAEEKPESSALSSSMDGQLLIYGGGGVGVILLLVLFVMLRKGRK